MEPEEPELLEDIDVTGLSDPALHQYLPAPHMHIKTVFYWKPPAPKVGTDVYAEAGMPNIPNKDVASGKKKKGKRKSNGAAKGTSMHPYASMILHKVLYAARMARPDLLKAISDLAGCLHCWTAACDVKLWRLMSYIRSTLDHVWSAEIGPCIEDAEVLLYVDADWGGCPETHRSTTGIYVELSGSCLKAPIAAMSRRQHRVSLSTSEAELVAAVDGLRLHGLPLQELWSLISGRDVPLTIQEDNMSNCAVRGARLARPLRTVAPRQNPFPRTCLRACSCHGKQRRQRKRAAASLHGTSKRSRGLAANSASLLLGS